MKGGHKAYWNDETMSDDLTSKALQYIASNKAKPFFLYFAIQNIHVPRVPNPRFVGKSGMGPRGDAILELDENTGKILRALDSLKLTQNTLVIFSSDNGPIINDGYEDSAQQMLYNHTPGGNFRGGKYSKYDAGTRVPTLVRWPSVIKPNNVSNALVGQNDFIASMATLLKQALPTASAPDSENMLEALLGKSQNGRNNFVEQGLTGLAIIQGDWKYIPPSAGATFMKDKNVETGNNTQPQLYNLKNDNGEKQNLAAQYPEKVEALSKLLAEIQASKK